MRSFISIPGTVLSVQSVSSFARILPSDPSSGHINIARGFTQGLGPLQVVYGKSPSEEPSNSLKEINRGSNDIGYNFGGPYIWLTQTKTINPTIWIRGMTLRLFDNAEPETVNGVPASLFRTPDLAKGASETYRYLYWLFADRGATPPFQEAALYRLDDGQGYIPPPGARTPPPGWKYISQDLNYGRRGGFLFVVLR